MKNDSMFNAKFNENPREGGEEYLFDFFYKYFITAYVHGHFSDVKILSYENTGIVDI